MEREKKPATQKGQWERNKVLKGKITFLFSETSVCVQHLYVSMVHCYNHI